MKKTTKSRIIETRSVEYKNKLIFINKYSDRTTTLGFYDLDSDMDWFDQYTHCEDMEFTYAYNYFLSVFYVPIDDRYKVSQVCKFLRLYDYFQEKNI